MKTETCKLYSRGFWIFLPKIIKIDLYYSELYCFKVGAFLRHCINFSTNLERIGVTDIGRKSQKDFTGADLGMGVTSALFHVDGGWPVWSTVLTKLATTGVSSAAQCLKTQWGILSVPAAVFL